MKIFKMRNIAIAVASALSMGAASQVMAAPQFTINMGAITGGGDDLRMGDFFSGTSTEYLNTIGNTHSGNGWLQIQSLSLNAVATAQFGTLPENQFNLYVTFDLEDVLASGSMNAQGSTYDLTKLDFVLWVDPSKDTILTAASAAADTAPMVGGTVADDYALAVGSLTTGTAGLTDLGGAFLNSINAFGVCSASGQANFGGVDAASPLCTNGVGADFFYDPNPFFDVAFTEFNNTSQGFAVTESGALVISSASGGVDFNVNEVPEPGLLSLLGIGLLAGFGASRKVKRS